MHVDHFNLCNLEQKRQKNNTAALGASKGLGKHFLTPLDRYRTWFETYSLELIL